MSDIDQIDEDSSQPLDGEHLFTSEQFSNKPNFLL